MDQNKMLVKKSVISDSNSILKTDQLHHILKIKDGVEFCLVCQERIHYDQNISEFNDALKNHLNSDFHKEGIKSLFELCNPDPLCNSLSDICVDIVNKSVFDISVLLGDETCYIYVKEGYFFCALCQKKFIEIMKDIQDIKYAIYSHMRGKKHKQNIKDTCWVYPLNSEKHFMLFHKTVVHCSVCKTNLHCEENSILQTIVHHLQSDQHNHLTSKNNVTADGSFASQVNSINVEGSSDIKENGHFILKDTYDVKTVKSELIENKYHHEYFKTEVTGNSNQLNKFEVEIEINKDSVYKSNYCNVLNQDSHPNVNNLITDKLKCIDESEVCDLNYKEIEEENLEDGIKINQKYIVTQNNSCFCKLCNKYIDFTKNHLSLIENVSQHFRRKHHMKSKLNDDLGLEKRVNNISNKDEMTFGERDNQCESEKHNCFERQDLLYNELSSIKQTSNLPLSANRLRTSKKVSGTSQSNINDTFMVIDYGMSYCILCWQQIRYSENNDVLTNRFNKHFSTEHHKINEKIRKNTKVIEKRTKKNMKSLLITIVNKANGAIKDREVQFCKKLLKDIEQSKKGGKLSKKERKQMIFLRNCLRKKFKKRNVLKIKKENKIAIPNFKCSELTNKSTIENSSKTNNKKSECSDKLKEKSKRIATLHKKHQHMLHNLRTLKQRQSKNNLTSKEKIRLRNLERLAKRTSVVRNKIKRKIKKDNASKTKISNETIVKGSELTNNSSDIKNVSKTNHKNSQKIVKLRRSARIADLNKKRSKILHELHILKQRLSENNLTSKEKIRLRNLEVVIAKLSK